MMQEINKKSSFSTKRHIDAGYIPMYFRKRPKGCYRNVFFWQISTESDSNFAQNSKFMKKIFIHFYISIYSNGTPEKTADFRIKRASISNYRGRHIKDIVFDKALSRSF